MVVGDDKQMPPTTFFDTVNKEEDDQEDEEELNTRDYESILAMFISQRAYSAMLRWHYRSKHPSLIQVSNEELYLNKLFLFPNAIHQDEQLGLKHHYLPDTYYESSKSSTNQLEAQAIAKAVMNHYRRTPKQSLGVVAFSLSQKEMIEDELELLRRRDPSLEQFFNPNQQESFFIKNLENVQGDERDVIMISIGYGKTQQGQFAMNFGPVNKQGGERRLNVLITRAKYRCEVFSNFRYVDMNLDKTQSTGVRLLHKFLKFAETGITDRASPSGSINERAFEEHVYQELTSRGYDVDTQIGSSEFKIDLAVRDPERPGKYILGIECDGAMYHQSRSARDRDRIRQNTLEQQGWTIYRIWSTEWLKHPTRELERLVEAIEKMGGKRARNPSAQKPKVTPPPTPPLTTNVTPLSTPSDPSGSGDSRGAIPVENKLPPFTIGEAQDGLRKMSFIMRVPLVTSCVKCKIRLNSERVNLGVYASREFIKTVGYIQTDLHTCWNCKYICADHAMVDEIVSRIRGYYIKVQDI